MISLAFWDFVTGLLARNIWMGRAALVLVVIVTTCLLIFILRELAAIERLRRIDGLRKSSETLQFSDNLNAVRTHGEKLAKLIKGRHELSWAWPIIMNTKWISWMQPQPLRLSRQVC